MGPGQDIVVILIFILILAAPIFYYIHLSSKVENLKEEKAVLISKIENYKQIKVKIDNLKKEIEKGEKLSEELSLRLKIYQELVDSKVEAKDTLKLSINSLPEGTWLESLKISINDGTLNGNAFNPKYISEYLTNLSSHFVTSLNSIEYKLSKNNMLYYSFSLGVKRSKGE